MNGNGISKLGINGLGRIGKLTLWRHVAEKSFKEIVINIGREAGKSLHDVAHYIERDSTYGAMHKYIYGCRGEKLIKEIDDTNGAMNIDDIKVTLLREKRNPAEIGWEQHGVRLVVDTTGSFLDPVIESDNPKGSIRGHLDAGAERVILSAPFKIKDKAKEMPSDCVTTVMGINENDYDPIRHKIVSAASCTTTCLAHMVKPLLDTFGAKRILSASMSTVHAATGSQEVLDRLSKGGAKDLRKSRSILNNIILTTTGAADTLALVIPEMKHIGFIAESVRIPTTTGSLVILAVNFQEDDTGESVRREIINEAYKKSAALDKRKYLRYSEEQNVSCDIIGIPGAAVIIEGHETHTRTAELTIDLERVAGVRKEILKEAHNTTIKVPITQAVIYGWYDNELGSYVNLLADRTLSIAEDM